jgi:hypothetical protein
MSEPRPPEDETRPDEVPASESTAPLQGDAGAWPAEPPTPTAWDQSLEEYFLRNRATFTPEALTRAAAAAGYSPEQIDSAMLRAEARDRGLDAIRPVRSRARLIVLLGYALVWVFFAIQFLLLPSPNSYMGSGLQTILSISLVIALGISLAWIRGMRPDPDRVGRALAILLAVPVVLLIAVAGLCLPSLPVR